MHSVTDNVSGQVTVYRYDVESKLISSYVYDKNTYVNLYGTAVTYDALSRVATVMQGYDYVASSGVSANSTVYEYSYLDDGNGNLGELTVTTGNLTAHVSPTYNNLGQITSRVVGFIHSGSSYPFFSNTTYSYVTSADGLRSGLVAQYTSTVSSGVNVDPVSSTTYNLTYDENGNLTQITVGNKVVHYVYDDLGQLIREDNELLDRTYTFTYDKAGNIQSKTTSVYSSGAQISSDTYTYGDSEWADLLTAYNGTAITYDTIGNPITIGTATLTWQGRELMSYVDNGTTVSYTYNADGIRTSKTIVSGGTITKHEYILSDSQIVRETVYLNNAEQHTVLYLYDDAGSPIAFRYRTPSYASGVYDDYFFEKNLQGDIIAIYDDTTAKVVTYTYDAWGNATVEGTSANTIGALNPFRYRGYYYDTETSLYYLQSRYYNSSWERFINADMFISTGQGIVSYNMFAYCNNSPITYVDSLGTLPKFAEEYLSQFNQWVETPKGLLRYVIEYNTQRKLYEHWVDSNHKVQWSRHHTDHGNRKTHPLVPHDHDWYDDDDGNHTQDHTPLPPNPGYKAPDSDDDSNMSEIIGKVSGIAIVGYLIYVGAKWMVAVAFAPATGGGSLVAAGVTP